MKYISFCFFLLFSFLFSPNIITAKTIVEVGVEDWKPLISKDPEKRGLAGHIIKQSFNAAGIEVKFVIYPWTRSMVLVEKGDLFATAPWYKTPEREKYAHFSEPICFATYRFFYKKERMGENFNYNKLTELKQYRIGASRKYWYVPIFYKEGLKLDFVSSETVNLKKLFIERIDLFPEEEIAGWYLIRELFPKEINQFAVTKTILRRAPMYLVVSKKYPNSATLVKKFNEGLIIIKKNGIYDKIVSKYLN